MIIPQLPGYKEGTGEAGIAAIEADVESKVWQHNTSMELDLSFAIVLRRREICSRACSRSPQRLEAALGKLEKLLTGQ
jgi:hypothetical protein